MTDLRRLRRALLRERLRNPSTLWAPLFWGALAALVGLLYASSRHFSSPALFSVVAFGVVFLIALFRSVSSVVSKATDDALYAFLDSYGRSNGMVHASKFSLPHRATPLLQRGDRRETHAVISGPLGEEIEGLLAYFTYLERTSNRNGERDETPHDFTLALCRVPESVPVMPVLYARRRGGPLAATPDGFGWMKRAHFESEVLDREFEFFVSPEQSQNSLLQLFSPSLIAWLTDEMGWLDGFEVEGGTVCVYFNGFAVGAEQLSRIREAAGHIGARLLREAEEATDGLAANTLPR